MEQIFSINTFPITRTVLDPASVSSIDPQHDMPQVKMKEQDIWKRLSKSSEMHRCLAVSDACIDVSVWMPDVTL